MQLSFFCHFMSVSLSVDAIVILHAILLQRELRSAWYSDPAAVRHRPLSSFHHQALKRTQAYIGQAWKIVDCYRLAHGSTDRLADIYCRLLALTDRRLSVDAVPFFCNAIFFLSETALL